MFIFHEASTRLRIKPVKTMTKIKFLAFIIAREAIEPRIFVAYFFIMFTRSVSYFHPTMVIIVFIYLMGGIIIIRR